MTSKLQHGDGSKGDPSSPPPTCQAWQATCRDLKQGRKGLGVGRTTAVRWMVDDANWYAPNYRIGPNGGEKVVVNVVFFYEPDPKEEGKLKPFIFATNVGEVTPG